jgi:hypothetical protein
LRAMMAASMLGVPEYSSDSKVVNRVGTIIGTAARHEERLVRASDGLPRSTSKITSPEQTHSMPNMWLWSVSICISFCMVGVVGVLAYWHLG